MIDTSDSDKLGVGWVEHGTLAIRTERDPEDLFVVQLHGELDLSCVEALESELRRIEATDVERILVDLSELEFIDSMGVRALLAAQSRAEQNGGVDRIAFRRGPASVQRVLELTHVEEILRFQD